MKVIPGRCSSCFGFSDKAVCVNCFDSVMFLFYSLGYISITDEQIKRNYETEHKLIKEEEEQTTDDTSNGC